MIEVHTLNAFTTPVFALQYSDSEKLSKEIVPIFKEIEQNDNNKYDYVNGYTNYSPNTNILELENLLDLQSFITNSIKQIHNRLELTTPIKLINSWFSIGRKNSMHERHNHLPAVWSGVYYIQAKNDDGNITFFNENLKSNWPFCETSLDNILTRQIFTIQPETGLMLVFPSYLEHQVHLNNTNNERIAISFNFGI